MINFEPCSVNCIVQRNSISAQVSGGGILKQDYFDERKKKKHRKFLLELKKGSSMTQEPNFYSKYTKCAPKMKQKNTENIL